MASIREDVGLGAVSRKSKYDFSHVKLGSSLHVSTSEERARLVAAFNYWGKYGKGKGAWATSRKVDATDPDGAGFRVWFMAADKKDIGVIKIGAPAEDEI